MLTGTFIENIVQAAMEKGKEMEDDVRYVPKTTAELHEKFQVVDEGGFTIQKSGEEEVLFHVRGVVQSAYVPCAANWGKLLQRVSDMCDYCDGLADGYVA